MIFILFMCSQISSAGWGRAPSSCGVLLGLSEVPPPLLPPVVIALWVGGPARLLVVWCWVCGRYPAAPSLGRRGGRAWALGSGLWSSITRLWSRGLWPPHHVRVAPWTPPPQTGGGVRMAALFWAQDHTSFLQDTGQCAWMQLAACTGRV